MARQSVILKFPESLVDKPIVSQVIRQFDIEMNILQAAITPEEDGRMFVIIKGSSESVSLALGHLRHEGVGVLLPSKNLFWDENCCVSCGACMGQCTSSALSLDPLSQKLTFDSERCIACELCIPVCFYKALESVGAHLKRTGELL